MTLLKGDLVGILLSPIIFGTMRPGDEADAARHRNPETLRYKPEKRGQLARLMFQLEASH